ncbi:MAG: hypothetical protein COA79_24955 [Planctomycetota bacterium]|nr:MAG: hypothetical protein COA79_24955 [Planctomycetota bacterium]
MKKHFIKEESFNCRLSGLDKHKLKIICQKTGFNQTEFLERMVEKEYERLKHVSNETCLVQLDLFCDQPIDGLATLFDNMSSASHKTA